MQHLILKENHFSPVQSNPIHKSSLNSCFKLCAGAKSKINHGKVVNRAPYLMDGEFNMP